MNDALTTELESEDPFEDLGLDIILIINYISIRTSFLCYFG